MSLSVSMCLKRLFCLLSAGLIFVRCAGTLTTGTSSMQVTPHGLMGSVRLHAARLKTFHANGRTLMVSPNGGFRGTVRIAAKLPDSLWMRIEGPLGVDVLRASFENGNVLLYYPRDQMAYTGTLEVMQSYGFIPVDLGGADLLYGMIGLFVSRNVESTRIIHSDSRHFLMTSAVGDSISVSMQGPVVSFWNKRDKAGDLLWEWGGEDYRKRGKVRLPHVVRMTQFQPRQRVTFFYERIQTNRRLNLSWFDPTLPEGVETIAL